MKITVHNQRKARIFVLDKEKKPFAEHITIFAMSQNIIHVYDIMHVTKMTF